jgi:hypothetical protein
MRDPNGQPWMALMKLGSKEHMEQFRTGLLYMNTLSYFRELEADAARADRFEGVDSILQPKDLGKSYFDSGIPSIGRINIRPEDLGGPITIAKDETLRCNLFCLYALARPAKDVLFPAEHGWFGDSLVLVTNTREFLRRVTKAAQEQKLPTHGAPVEYYDENDYSGQVGRFKKSSRFAYQNEYRIAIEAGVDGPFRFEIGDIHDITSEVIPFEQADEHLKFTEADAREAGLTW